MHAQERLFVVWFHPRAASKQEESVEGCDYESNLEPLSVHRALEKSCNTYLMIGTRRWDCLLHTSFDLFSWPIGLSHLQLATGFARGLREGMAQTFANIIWFTLRSCWF